MSPRFLSTQNAQHVYDALAIGYEKLDLLEANSRELALQRLALEPGVRLLDVGLGSGAMEALIAQRFGAQVQLFGVDISAKMLTAARRRAPIWLAQASGEALPFASASFDRLLCAYVLDLVAPADLPQWLTGFRRVLRPGGRLVIVSLTEGVDVFSRLIVGLWKAVYAITPVLCAGCRPLQLQSLVCEAGFDAVQRQVITQAGVPSEVVWSDNPK